MCACRVCVYQRVRRIHPSLAVRSEGINLTCLPVITATEASKGKMSLSSGSFWKHLGKLSPKALLREYTLGQFCSLLLVLSTGKFAFRQNPDCEWPWYCHLLSWLLWPCVTYCSNPAVANEVWTFDTELTAWSRVLCLSSPHLTQISLRLKRKEQTNRMPAF